MSPFTIALIDDQEANRYALARYLREAGYQVLEGSSGREALALAQQKPDLMILDIKLPDASGIDICQQLKQDPHTANLLVLQTSALFTTTHDRVLGLESGADAYLTAPFEPRELLAQVKALLRIKETESALRQSQERFRSILADKSDPFFSVNSEGRFILVNAACEELSGYAASELLNMTFLELCAPDQRDHTLAAFQGGLTEGKPGKLETAMIRKDGQRVELTATRNCLFVENGITQLYYTVKDITKHKQMEEAFRQNQERLRASEERLVLAQEAGGVGVYDWNVVTGEIVWTAQLEKIYGMKSPEGGREKHEAWLSHVHPEDRPGSEESTRQWLESTQKDQYWEYRFIRPDGQERWISGHSRVFRDDQNRPLRVVGTNVDITDRKRAEQALHQSAERYEQQVRLFDGIASTTPDFVYVFDLQGRFLYANRRLLEVWGMELPAVIGKTCLELGYEPWHHDMHMREIRQVIETKQPIKGEVPFKAPLTGIYGVYEYIFTPVLGPDQEVESIAGTTRDVTERRRAEDEIRRLNADLEQRVQMRTADLQRLTVQLRKLAKELTLSEERERQRTAHVLHDNLQQLLVASLLRMEGLQQDSPSKIRGNDLEAVTSILKESLQVTRSLTYELSPPVLLETNLAAALRWLGSWFEKQYNLQVQVEADQTVNVAAQELRLTVFRCVQELLFNVVKHAQVQSAKVTLRQTSDQAIEIGVCDSGRGFDPDQLSTRECTETGFGLFHLCEQLESLGGRFRVDSAPGQGSRFTLLIPSCSMPIPARTESRSTVLPPPRIPLTSQPIEKRKIQIILADDHHVIRQGLIRVIEENEHFEVVGQAADGQQAIELAHALQPDVILMDVSMPRLNGIEATRIIRTELPQIKIIGLSMFEDEAHTTAMRNAGALTLLHKSSPATNLITTILGCFNATR